MFIKIHRWAAFLPLAFLLCCKSNPDKGIIPEWNSELLGPLVKTKVTGEEILQLQDLSIFSFSTVYDFGYGNEGQPDSIPEVNLPDISKTEVLNTFFVDMELEKGTIYFKVSNTLDIDIKKGAIISIGQGGVNYLTDTLKTDLSPKGGVFISKAANLAGKKLLPEFTVTVKQLGTHGTYGLPLQPGDKKLVVHVFIQEVSFNSITLKPGSYSISDTSAFNLHGRTIKTDAVTGDVFAYVKNNFSFTTDMQFYFMDGNYVRKDSLFTVPVTILPSTSANPESSIKQSLEPGKVDSIKQSVFVNSLIRFYSSQNVTISKENFVDLQLVGDLKISVNK